MKTSYYRINKEYLKSYWTSFKGVATAPFHWKGRDWARFAIITGTAGVLMFKLDRPVKNFIVENRSALLDQTTRFFYPLGNQIPPVLLTGMYLAGVITHDRRLEHAALSIARSLAISTVFYTATKGMIRRLRPDRTDNPLIFARPFSGDYSSFPSGHANTAFAVATAFALEFKNAGWLPWLVYPLAAMTAFDRMYQNRHWASDLIIGASIGHFVTRTIYRLETKKQKIKTVY